MNIYIIKKLRAFISLLLIVVVFMHAPVLHLCASDNAKNDKRACWISFLDFETYLKDLDETEFTDTVSSMYDNIKAHGMNTVIVHVRAFGDAIYPSDKFPQAEFISSYRRIMDYDALDIMVRLAHEKELTIEAWINPYRLSKDNETTVSYKNTLYYEKYKDFIIEYTSSSGETALSLDPSRAETVTLICDGVREIVSKYDVDGIHFDDYFYMPGMADDLDVSTKTEYVNTLVRSVYSTIKESKPYCTFGISPAGNTDNARCQGADIDTWLSTPGYIDYIMPQIYWTDSYYTNEGMVNMFSDRCSEWQALNKLDLPIYVGLALYRTGEQSSVDTGWANSDSNLCEQYSAAYNLGYDGYALFRYEWLDKDIAASELSNLGNYIKTIPDGYEYVSAYNAGSNNKSDDKGIDDVKYTYVSVDNISYNGDLEYRIYRAGYGWQSWQTDSKLGYIAGETSAIQVRISDTSVYDVMYRVYTDEDGWLMWNMNSHIAGIPGGNGIVTDVQLVLIPKGDFVKLFGAHMN